MGTQGFYRGTSHDQVPFFADKEKKMIENRRWPPEYDEEVDIARVNLDVVYAWITKRITELLGFEDDIVIDYCKQQLNPPPTESAIIEKVCPKKLQINLTGFLAKNAGRFVKELWSLLLTAQLSPNGVPEKLLEFKQNELEAKQQQNKIITDVFSKINSPTKDLSPSKHSPSISSYSSSYVSKTKSIERPRSASLAAQSQCTASSDASDRSRSTVSSRNRGTCPSRRRSPGRYASRTPMYTSLGHSMKRSHYTRSPERSYVQRASYGTSSLHRDLRHVQRRDRSPYKRSALYGRRSSRQFTSPIRHNRGPRSHIYYLNSPVSRHRSRRRYQLSSHYYGASRSSSVRKPSHGKISTRQAQVNRVLSSPTPETDRTLSYKTEKKKSPILSKSGSQNSASPRNRETHVESRTQVVKLKKDRWKTISPNRRSDCVQENTPTPERGPKQAEIAPIRRAQRSVSAKGYKRHHSESSIRSASQADIPASRTNSKEKDKLHGTSRPSRIEQTCIDCKSQHGEMKRVESNFEVNQIRSPDFSSKKNSDDCDMASIDANYSSSIHTKSPEKRRGRSEVKTQEDPSEVTSSVDPYAGRCYMDQIELIGKKEFGSKRSKILKASSIKH